MGEKCTIGRNIFFWRVFWKVYSKSDFKEWDALSAFKETFQQLSNFFNEHTRLIHTQNFTGWNIEIFFTWLYYLEYRIKSHPFAYTLFLWTALVKCLRGSPIYIISFIYTFDT